MAGNLLGALKRLFAASSSQPDNWSTPRGASKQWHSAGDEQATRVSRPWASFMSSRGEPDETATYRVRHTGDGVNRTHWDPYDSEWSRAHRVREARRRPAPQRVESHYTLLGVEETATDAQIERAYRRFVAKIHPDRFFDDPGRRALAEEKLKQLNGVMRILRDPALRAGYDATIRGQRNGSLNSSE